MNFKRQRSFTLIELLVVIAIIGILSAAILIAINPAKRSMQARDAQRKNDIGAITNAVIGYEALTGKPPASRIFSPLTGCDRSNGSSNNCTFPGDTDWSSATGIYFSLVQSQQFLKKLPIDPINNTTYYYWYHMEGTDIINPTGYWIGGRLESPQNPAYPIYRCSDWSTLPKGCMEVSNFLQ